MGKILVDLNDIDKIRKSEVIGNGKEGRCYRLEDGSVAKIYHVLCVTKKLYFDSFQSDSIAFPKDTYIYKSTDLIQGYTMDYLDGQKFVGGFSENLALADLKLAIQNARDLIAKYPDIHMIGLTLGNLLFDYQNNKFNILGAGRWYPQQDALDKNISSFNFEIMTSLCRGNLDWVNNPLNQDKKLHELYRMYKTRNESLPIEFLEELESKISDIKEEKVKTIGDLTYKRCK